mgnify:CR=1 FL=1|tara:strand:+ start:127 stop:636 length:510 start_codon:yes stop_codon:yes gene_type:complete
MKKKHKYYLRRPLYLNANLLYSEALNYIKKQHWKRAIKTGTLKKLKENGFKLVTSILTRMEVMQRLSLEENQTITQARKIYFEIVDKYNIKEITAIHRYIVLHDDFIETIARSNLDFKDAFHLQIAKNTDIPLCTHDKKLRKNYSNHEAKSKFYEAVFKPEDLIRPKKR